MKRQNHVWLKLPVLWLLFSFLLVGLPSNPVAEEKTAESLAGRFLVATPSLADPNFGETVVMMLEHQAHGALGLVINRPLGEAPADKILALFDLQTKGPAGNLRVHRGGPVEPGAIFVLHGEDYRHDTTEALGKGIFLTAVPEILRALAEDTGPARYLFAFGYAGWGPGQLEGEIAGGYWEDVASDPEILFGKDAEKWARARAALSINL